MNDPLSRGKIEDVILSIRRLVSESDADQPPPEADRLLLTPSLRIGEAASGAEEPEPGAAPQNGTAQPDIEATLAALEAEVSEKAGQWNGSLADPAEPEPPEAAVEAEVPEPAPAEEGFDDWEPAEAEPRGAPVDDGEVIELKAAEIEAPRAARGDDAVSDMGAADIDSLLDERELRALVAEVLREELKGPLGERITRNVRKLVRREIALALSSLNLD